MLINNSFIYLYFYKCQYSKIFSISILHFQEMTQLPSITSIAAREQTFQQELIKVQAEHQNIEKICLIAEIKAEQQRIRCNYSRSIQWHRFIVQNTPFKLEIYLRFANTLFEAKHYAQVDQLLSTAWKLSGSAKEDLLKICLFFENHQDFQNTLRYGLRLLMLDPYQPQALKLCWTYSQQILDKTANDIADSTLQPSRHFNDINLWIKGLVMMHENKPKAAEIYFRQCIKLNENFYIAYHWLIKLLQQQHRHQQIQTLLLHSFKQIATGQIEQKHHYSNFLASLDDDYSIFPLRTVYLFLYYCDHFSKSNEVALFYLKVMSMLDSAESSKSGLYYHIAINYKYLKNLKEAELWFLRMLEMPSCNQNEIWRASINHHLALIYCKQGKHQKAKSLLTQLREDVTDQVSIEFYGGLELIQVYDLLKQYGQLLQTYKALTTFQRFKGEIQCSEYKWIKVYVMIAHYKLGHLDISSVMLSQIMKQINRKRYSSSSLHQNGLFRLIDHCLERKLVKEVIKAYRCAKRHVDLAQRLNRKDLQYLTAKIKSYEKKITTDSKIWNPNPSNIIWMYL